MFGVMRAGGISALSSPGYTEDEMMHVLKTVGCRFIITSVSGLRVVQDAARRLNIDENHIFILNGQVRGFKAIEDLLESGRRYGVDGQVRPAKLPSGLKNNEVCTMLCFSSGTTGLPKAVG